MSSSENAASNYQNHVLCQKEETLKFPFGIKHDTNKLPWDLLPYDALTEVVKVLQFGAKKYAPRNWEHGLVFSRYFAATMRHLVAFFTGEDNDKETGISHLAHACCCVMFILALHIRKVPKMDDRTTDPIYKGEK